MTDVMTPDQRRRCMSRIRGTDTKPELMLRRMLWTRGFRYRLHYRLPGRPDLSFPGQKVAIFVDGCFWHGCPDHAVKPKANAEFWARKLGKNRERDRQVNAQLKAAGWQVLRYWEHEVRNNLDEVVQQISDTVAP